MKTRIGILISTLSFVLLLSACAPQTPPELSISVAESPLLQGSEATVHVKITNPGADELQNVKALIGYAPENDSSMVEITVIDLSLSVGGTFEQDIPWLVNFQPDPNAKYQVRLTLVTADGSSLGETSAGIEFTQPTVAVSIDQSSLAPGALAVISVEVTNPSGVDMQGYSLNIGYGVENDSSSILIQDVPFDLKAGETLTQKVPWTVDSFSSSGEYEVRAALIMPGSIYVDQAVTTVTLTGQ